MPNGLPITYPEDAPEWLPDWLPERDIRGMFSEGLRRMAYRVLGTERHRSLRWDERKLIGRIGDQEATWRFAGSDWRTSCTCGYPGGRCLHAYAVACMFHEVCQHEDWPLPKTRSGHSSGTPRRVSASRDRGVHESESSAMPRERQQGNVSSSRLTVELDFHHESDHVGVRFYLDSKENRRLLRMQSVFNYAAQAARGEASPLNWSREDARFLRWLHPQLARRPEMRTNLQMLKLRHSEFEKWLGRWESAPGRFVERSSQQVFSSRGTAHSHLVIELLERGTKVQIGAVVVSPSGHRYYLHEVLRMLAKGDEETVMGGELIRFDPPFSAKLLKDVFAARPRTTDRENICPHLSALIGNRLDIVEGPCVRQHVRNEGTVTLTATDEGDRIRLKGEIDGVAIRPSMNVSAGNLRDDGERFHIDVYHVAAADHIRRELRTLAGTENEEGAIEIPAGSRHIDRLVALWRRLPEEVNRQLSPALKPLLDRTCILMPEVFIREEGSVLAGEVSWECGDVRLSHEDVRRALRRGTETLRTAEGSWLSLSPAGAQKALDAMRDLNIDPAGQFRVLKHDAPKKMRLLETSTELTVSGESRSLVERVATAPAPAPVVLSEHLSSVLRPYQQAGFEFMAQRAIYGVGSILADDMGLGKTLQVLSLLEGLTAQRRSRGEPFRALVICPSSVIGVWRQQCEQFCPSLDCRTYRGPRDKREEILTGPWDALVTNYALARIDADLLGTMTYDVLVLDEAQYIKNPDAQVTQAVKGLQTSLTLALTGTPLENRLLDLWSIMDAVNPGYLKDPETFANQFDGPSGPTQLSQRIAPVVLRRTKRAVAPELPQKTEEVITVEMSGLQEEVYRRELIRARQTLREKGPIEILAALTRLRQICCHPDLVLEEPSGESSAKLEALCEMVQELADEGHSALVFSQFTSMLDIIRPVLKDAGLHTMTITGQTPVDRRTELVRRFEESDESQVMLLSLRAAGTGLTLTKADYVFLYDPWWNPAVEAQAIDRTHRIGQDKPIFAYRLAVEGSVEEKVMSLQQEKAELFAAVMGDTDSGFGQMPKFSADDLARLLA